MTSQSQRRPSNPRALRHPLLWLAAPLVLLDVLFPISVLLANLPALLGGGAAAGLLSASWPLISAALLLTLPLTVWLLAASFWELPRRLADAALAGGSPLRAYARAGLALAAPGLVSAALIAFIGAWSGLLASYALPMLGNIGLVTLLALAASLIVGAPLALALALRPQTGASPGSARSAGSGWLRHVGRLHLAWLGLGGPARVVLAVLALGAFIYTAEGWRAIAFPYALDYGEAPLLEQALRLVHGQTIYRADLTQPPYTIANYPPLYTVAQAPLAWLFGPAFWYGRLLSWLAMLGAALFVGRILHTLTGDRLAALVGGLTLLALPYTRYWGPLARIDSLALCLSLAALLVVVRAVASTQAVGGAGAPLPRNRDATGERPIWPAVVGAALLLVAAVATRQSYGLAAPLAAFIWLWAHGLRRQALALAGLAAGLGLGLFGLLNLVTGGGFFFNIITANINELKVELLGEYLGELATFMPILVLITALFVLLAGSARPTAWRLLLPYAAGATLSALTIAKVGSNINYLLELCAAMSLAAGATVAWQRRAPRLRPALMIGLALQLALLLPGMRYQVFSQFKLDSRDEMALIAERIRSTDQPVLADEDIGLLVLAGRPLLYQPFELTQLARAGIWNQAPLLAAIEHQEYTQILIFKFPLVPLDRDRWTDEMRQAIDRRYTAVEQIGYTVVYRPNDAPAR